jgi:hypothetical protein
MMVGRCIAVLVGIGEKVCQRKKTSNKIQAKSVQELINMYVDDVELSNIMIIDGNGKWLL